MWMQHLEMRTLTSLSKSRVTRLRSPSLIAVGLLVTEVHTFRAALRKSFDTDRSTITVRGNIRYGTLCYVTLRYGTPGYETSRYESPRKTKVTPSKSLR